MIPRRDRQGRRGLAENQLSEGGAPRRPNISVESHCKWVIEDLSFVVAGPSVLCGLRALCVK